MEKFKDYGLWHIPVETYKGYTIYRLENEDDSVCGYTILHKRVSKKGAVKLEFIGSFYTLKRATHHLMEEIFGRFKREIEGKTELKMIDETS